MNYPELWFDKESHIEAIEKSPLRNMSSNYNTDDDPKSPFNLLDENYIGMGINAGVDPLTVKKHIELTEWGALVNLYERYNPKIINDFWNQMGY